MSAIGDDVPVVYVYTRATALKDGVLVDVSKLAGEAGFTYPVAVTRRVYDELVTPDPRSTRWGQSVDGRLWDLVWMLSCAIRASRGRDQGVVMFRCIFVLKERQRRTVTLKAMVGPGDAGEPVVTVMYPEEN